MSFSFVGGTGAFPAWLQAERPRDFLLLPEPVLPWQHGGAHSSLLHVPHCWGRSSAMGTGLVGPIGARVSSVPLLSLISLPRHRDEWCQGPCWCMQQGGQEGEHKAGLRLAGTGERGWWPGWQEKPGHDGSREAGPCWQSCVMLSPDQLKVSLPQSGSLHIIRRFELELNLRK